MQTSLASPSSIVRVSMARQKLPPPPPPPPPPPTTTASQCESDSPSDEEKEVVTQQTPSLAKNKQLLVSGSGSGSGSGSESEDHDSSSKDEDEVEEPPKAKKPESEPDKKKVKLSSSSVPNSQSQLPSKKSSSFIHRIWSRDDEKTLVEALSDYQARNGKLPSGTAYASFLSTLRGSISFPATDKQLFNKIRTMRHTCRQKRDKGMKGSNASSSNSDGESSLLRLWTELFEASNKASEKKVGGTTDGRGGANGGDVAGSYFYLGGLIKDVMQQCPGWFPTVEDAIAQIGDSNARDLEAKAKKLRIDMMNLYMREEKLKAELLESFTHAMVHY